MKPVGRQRNLILWPLLWGMAFFCVLWRLDFPKPFFDDLFFIGAALNLAGGGTLSNPLIARQQFPTSLYFLHPPVHSFTLAAWLKVFGISASSLTGFQFLMYLLTMGATIAILRRHGAPALLEWLVPLGVSTAFLPVGFRHEPLSAALSMIGFAVVECGCVGALPVFVGFLLMFLGGSAAERLSVFTVALVILAAYRLWRGGMPVARLCTLAGAALLAACLVSLVLIDFRLGEFWRAFRFNATPVVGASRLTLIRRFLLDILGVTQLPVLLLCVGLLPFGLRSRDTELNRVGLFVFCGFPVLAVIGGLGHGALWYAIFVLFVVTAALLKGLSRPLRVVVQALLVAVLLIANSRNLVQGFGIITGQIDTEQGSRRSDALALRSTTEHPVLIDVSVARYVFDYRIPKGFLDWDAAAPYPLTMAVQTNLRAGDIYLVGPSSVDLMNNYTYLNQPVPRWSPLKLNRWAFHRNPRRIFIIPAESCGGLRAGPSAH